MRAKLLAFAILLSPLALHQDGAKPPASGPEVGQPAPTIRLNDHTGTAATVGGEGQRWSVLAFYPKAATPG